MGQRSQTRRDCLGQLLGKLGFLKSRTIVATGRQKQLAGRSYEAICGERNSLLVVPWRGEILP